MTADLTPAEQSEATAMLAALHESGYRDVKAHGDRKPGVRIRHHGHQWSEAYANGTGVVLHVTERDPSSWSQSWGAPDVELVVAWDSARFGSRLAGVAQYHVDVEVVASTPYAEESS